MWLDHRHNIGSLDPFRHHRRRSLGMSSVAISPNPPITETDKHMYLIHDEKPLYPESPISISKAYGVAAMNMINNVAKKNDWRPARTKRLGVGVANIIRSTTRPRTEIHLYSSFVINAGFQMRRTASTITSTSHTMAKKNNGSMVWPLSFNLNVICSCHHTFALPNQEIWAYHLR